MDSLGSGSNRINRMQEMILRGCVFTMTDYFTFDADETKYFLLDPTSCQCKHIKVTNLVFDATVGPIKLDFYVGTQASNNGVIYSLFNRNDNNQNIAETKIRLNPTISDNGLRIAGRCICATGANPITGTPSIDEEDKYLILNKTKKYLIAAHNTNGAGAIMQLDFTVCEVN